MLQTRNMKVRLSSEINPFGGLNFVLEEFERQGIAETMAQELPNLAAQCKYDWKDIIYSFFNIYFCGGDCIEDIGTHLGSKLKDIPYHKVPSPDRILDRLKELCTPLDSAKSLSGKEHQYNVNESLSKINLSILKKLNRLNQEELTIDYDNTIIPTEKADAKPSYKSGLGYQPAIATLNVHDILYIENRNGNCSAIAFQAQTISRMHAQLELQGISKVNNFRADAASYSHKTIEAINKFSDNFYIGTPQAPITATIEKVSKWAEYIDNQDVKWLIGEATYTPFFRKVKACDRQENLKSYRLIIKKKLRANRQIKIETKDAYDYRGVLTNNTDKSAMEVLEFYHQRGAMEKEFDVLKNDFGWSNLPFSKLEQNTVYLILTSICRNLYRYIIEIFSKRVAGLSPTYRIKKFIFRFITVPAKWIRRSRQNILVLYGNVAFKV